jgi:hypothetical protein
MSWPFEFWHFWHLILGGLCMSKNTYLENKVTKVPKVPGILRAQNAMLDDFDPYVMTAKSGSVKMPEGGDSLDLLRAIYQDEHQTLGIRMRAASIAIKYERPALAVTALTAVGSFEEAMGLGWDERMRRARERASRRLEDHRPIIDATIVEAETSVENVPTAEPQVERINRRF